MQPFDSIDWSAPWLLPWSSSGKRVAVDAQLHTLVNALNLYSASKPSALAMQFVDQSALESDFTYEAFIYENRCIPTRNNLHDFFNGLSWLEFPKIKTATMYLQAMQLQAVNPEALHPQDHSVKLPNPKMLSERPVDSTPGSLHQAALVESKPQGRGALRDALTVFDENAVLLQADNVLWDALEARDWQSLFVKHRKYWSSARVWIFGHALLEKLEAPRLPITGHVLRARVPQGLDALGIDAWLGPKIECIDWISKPFFPLPVLGVPGWWPANEESSFYANKDVFRDPHKKLS